MRAASGSTCAPMRCGFARRPSARATWLGTEGDASRLRLILEAGRTVRGGRGGDVHNRAARWGVRVDGGDAETGTGLELGAGVSYIAGALTIEGQVRALVAHEASGYGEWGASGAIRVTPSESGRGLTLSLVPVWGSAGSASERLWSARTAGELEGRARVRRHRKGRSRARLRNGRASHPGRRHPVHGPLARTRGEPHGQGGGALEPGARSGPGPRRGLGGRKHRYRSCREHHPSGRSFAGECQALGKALAQAPLDGAPLMSPPRALGAARKLDNPHRDKSRRCAALG